MISIGPTIRYPHSPEEKANIRVGREILAVSSRGSKGISLKSGLIDMRRRNFIGLLTGFLTVVNKKAWTAINLRSDNMKKAIKTDKAPKAIGPYSQGIIGGGFIFVSGQIPLDPASGEIVGQTIEEQAHSGF